MEDKSISEILEEVIVEMCDEYCKYPQLVSEEELYDVCAECPLNRL